MGAANRSFKTKKGNYGPWQFHRNNLILRHAKTGYEIDLEECGTSAEILDWIFQVAGKSWATDKTIADLIRALEDLIDPQATICSWGVDRPFDLKMHFNHGVIVEVTQ